MRAVVPLLVLAGCTKDGASDPSPKPHEQPPHGSKLAGVYPDEWKCESIATMDALGQVLGGTARRIESATPTPRGLPHPCNYEIDASGTSEFWTFDVDCRDGMKQRADALFEQYKATSAEMVAQYNAATADAGVKAAHPAPGSAGVDAGAPVHPPELAVDVPVGAKGLDHHGQGLIFIDDDAPCYVRVVGPDAARRLDLAKMLAKNLTFANAPMKPRSMP
jgi:hypothetical protein